MKAADLKAWCGACAVESSGTKAIMIGRLNTARAAPVPAKEQVTQRAPTKRGEERFPHVGHAPALGGLPVDVLAHVLGQLCARGVCRVAATCSALRASVGEGGLWRLLFLSNCDLVAERHDRLQMPPAAWRSLCSSLARYHLTRERAQEHHDAQPPQKHGTGGHFRPPSDPAAWCCPADGCSRQFPKSWRLFKHLTMHYEVAPSQERVYCSRPLCTSFFPSAHSQVLLPTPECWRG